MTNQDSKVERERGPLYWFLHNVTGGYRRHRFGVRVASILLCFALFVTRAFYQHYVVLARQKSFLLALAVLLVVFWVWARRKSARVKLLASALLLAGLAVLFLWGGAVHDYVALYYRYRTLQMAELTELPITGHERLQPLNSIYSLAREKAATEMESPQSPDYVRISNEYKWTMAVEPAHLLPRFGRVKELISVNDRSPDFSKRESVNFEVGENMLLGKNSHAATVKSFGLWRFLSYEPTDVKYVKDDQGQWVQVVSLIRWSGLFFPRPEFGGVQVIRQEQASLLGDLRLMLFGTGEWIRPGDIGKYPYLVGQNLLPYEVSRYIAHSFRFQGGFFGPLPGNRQGDVRIPDLPEDVNDQPFTTYFQVQNKPGVLYHYFALEPWDPDKQGLSVSLFIPSDGLGPTYVYRHYLHGDSLTGVSAISAKVMDTRKEYDWTRHTPVEHRPFIRDIGGVRRFYWLTTVVTRKEGNKFIAGTQPNIVITDAATNVPIWVSLDPEKWTEEIKK